MALPTKVPNSVGASLRLAYVIINANQREGTSRALVEVAARMGRKHDAHLFSRTADDIDLSNIHWHRVPGFSRPEVANFASFVPTCSWMLQQRDWSLVHSAGCNVGSANVFTIQNIQRAKIKVMDRLGREETVSGPRRLSRWLHLRVTSLAERRFYSRRTGRRAPLFLPVSRGVETELRSNYDLGAALVRVIPNAADTEKFHPLTEGERVSWRQQNGISEKAIVMIFAGGEWARKGLDLALRALPKLSDPEVIFFVAGDDADRARFQNLATELGVGERVIFGGFRKDIATALGAANLFLFPSWYEAFSLATIEAAACGLPVVATRINGTEDFIREGETGAFIEHEPDHIAAVLNALIADATRLNSMGARARKLVETDYTWDMVAERTEAAYRDYLEI